MRTFHLSGFGDLPLGRKQAYSFYKMVPLDDGFPGRVTEAGHLPHPIYATYLIRDFLTVHSKTGERDALASAMRIADATIARMTTVGDALLLYYEDNGLIGHAGRFYSGLTQARYLMPLFDLAEATGEAKYASAARAVLMSLMISAQQGGVMRQHGKGVVIEEFPHEAPNYVLNGWTTAMIQVFEYARAAGDEDAQRFGEANMLALMDLLPLYDMPEIANSRYRLSGTMRHQLTGRHHFRVLSGRLRAGDESFEIHHADEKETWGNTIRHEEKRVLIDAILQRHIMPRDNVLDLVIESAEAQELQYRPRYVDYLPVKGLRAKEWGEKRPYPVVKGKQKLSIRIPWSDCPWVGEPTNFCKRVPELDGTIRHRNVYHWLHISNLWTLYELTYEPSLLPWISKWIGYSKRWPTMDIYQHPEIDYRPVGTFKVDFELVSALSGDL